MKATRPTRTTARGLAARDLVWIRARTDVNPVTGCHIWQMCLSSGYGKMYVSVNGQRHNIRVHRRVLELTLGRPLGPGMCALHHCDNPPCCNPDHLYEGSHLQNMRQMYAKERRKTARGERVGTSKLKVEQVREIKADLALGVHPSVLASRYGVGESTVGMIKYGRNWRHV